MGCMKLCGNFPITSEPEEEMLPTVAHCSGPSLCSCIGPGSAQCEYTIRALNKVSMKATAPNFCHVISCKEWQMSKKTYCCFLNGQLSHFTTTNLFHNCLHCVCFGVILTTFKDIQICSAVELMSSRLIIQMDNNFQSNLSMLISITFALNLMDTFQPWIFWM